MEKDVTGVWDGKIDRKEHRRPFWLGLGLGLFVFLTAAGMLAVDYEGRKLSFGDSTPLARLEHKGDQAQLKVKAFGRETSWDVTGAEEALDFLREFACLPKNRE